MACLLGLEGSRGLRRGLSVSLAALALSVIGSVFVAQEAIATHLPYGPYTCQQGFVWRETVPGDRVCVTPQTRDQVRAENALAASRQSPNGGPYGPKTCMQGFVWRETRPSDRVCVPAASRDQAQRDNAQAPSRLAAPGQTPRGGVTGHYAVQPDRWPAAGQRSRSQPKRRRRVLRSRGEHDWTSRAQQSRSRRDRHAAPGRVCG